jgi:hypothetical protein
VRLITIGICTFMLASCSGLWNRSVHPQAAADQAKATVPADIVIRSADNPFPEAVTRCGSSYGGARLVSLNQVPDSNELIWRYVCVR